MLTATDADGNTSEFSPTSEELGGPGSSIASLARDQLIPLVRTRRVVSLTPPYPNPFNPQTTFTFDGAGIASGTYLLRVDGGQFVETCRLIFLK